MCRYFTFFYFKYFRCGKILSHFSFLEERDEVIIKVKTQKKSGRDLSGKDFVPITPPPSWEEAFLKIQEYRKTHPAPVDSMGCERTDVQDLTPKEFRFHVLIALMLSSQTRDEETYAAMAKLRKAGGGKLTAEVLDVMNENTLHDCIKQVGFHNMKTKYVKNAARICIEKHEGDIPSTLKDLMALPGVGPKMAFLAMQCGWDVNIGIGVDVHVHRITNRLGWVQTKHPEETRASLESWLPEKWWKAINFLLVGLGQTVCYGNRPRCYACPVSDLCPSRDPTSVAPAKGKPLPRIRSAEPKILLEIEKPQAAAKVVRSRHFIKEEAPSETDPLFEE
ncbi:alpha,alpha-trehalase nth1 [Entomophthora muscae]|uniref:Alpha,alpha-trehalase nth1 n=1 Tax=Entomophthora muscae TaxID=34485 RepID=A0ACC2TFM7_9FUNG|nr:alpha,alpha-trehalase nth1 [Entomophthora muscae]